MSKPDNLARLEGDRHARENSLQRLDALVSGGLFSDRIAANIREKCERDLRELETEIFHITDSMGPEEKRGIAAMRCLARERARIYELFARGLINEWGIGMGLWEEPLPLVHNLNGTLIGMVHIMLPFLVLPVYASMKAISNDFVKAAANLGATPMQAFWKVFFPLSLPGMFAGSLIVFVLSLGFYVTPAVLGGGRVIMVSMKITDIIEIHFNWGAASALGVVLLIMTLGILWAASRLLKLDKILGGGGH